MKLENQVVSLELAKKLKDLGVEQESLFCWKWVTEKTEETYYRTFELMSWEDAAGFPRKHVDPIAAFTVAELGELLPTEQNDRLGFFSGRAINGWFCEIKNYGVMPYDRLHVELQHKTEADARAKMLVYLLENKLITV